MRKYRQHFDGHEVDLDNPKTYKHLPKTEKELDDRMFKEIGYALVYMDFFPDRKDGYPKKKIKITKAKIKVRKFSGRKEADWWYNCGWFQRQRVHKLIKNFAENRRKKGADIKWLKEQLFLLDDETENMC